MRLDQIIKRVDRLSVLEKLALTSILMNELGIKGEWLTAEERLEQKMRKKTSDRNG